MTPDQQALLNAVPEHERRHPIDPKNPPKVVRDLLRLIEQDVIESIRDQMSSDPSCAGDVSPLNQKLGMP